VDEALNAYRMAYELDPADGAAMSSAAYLFQVRGRIYDALMLEARAMSIRQNRYSRYADSQIALSLELIDHPGARDWRERAQRISPNNVVVLAEVAESLLRDGRPEASQTLLLSQENEIAANPRLTRLMGRAALALGDLPRAQALFERAGSRAATDLAAIHVLQGDPAMAREKLKDLEAAMLAGDTWPEMRIGAAELHAVLGNHDLAIAYVSRAVDLGWRDLAWLQKSPYLSVTSKKPGWLALEKRIDAQIEMQSRLVSQSDLLRSVLTI
jgi:tetratricopeptide (TPR) repeat protein